MNTASELLEQAVQLVTNDNLDLGCAVIEQAATDKVSSHDYVFSACVFVFHLREMGVSSSSVRAFFRVLSTHGV